MVAATSERFQRLDILVNDVGIYGFWGLSMVTPELIDRHINLNKQGSIFATQAAD